MFNLIQAAKNQDPRGFPAGWKERLHSVLHSDWRDHLPVPAEEDSSPEPSAASEDRPTAIKTEASDRDLDSGCPTTPPTVEIHTNKSRSDRGTVPRNQQGGKSAPGVSASASTLSWGDVASSSNAPARPATSPSTVSADATLQANWSLAAALLAKIGDSRKGCVVTMSCVDGNRDGTCGDPAIRRMKF